VYCPVSTHSLEALVHSLYRVSPAHRRQHPQSWLSVPNPFRHSFVSFRSASVVREFVSYSFLTTHIDVVSRHRTSSIHGFLIKHVCFKTQ